jgi:hypothetical protein
VKQAKIDEGVKPGTTSEDAARIRALEQEVRELRRANLCARRRRIPARRSSTARRRPRWLHRRAPRRVPCRAHVHRPACGTEQLLRRQEAADRPVGPVPPGRGADADPDGPVDRQPQGVRGGQAVAGTTSAATRVARLMRDLGIRGVSRQRRGSSPPGPIPTRPGRRISSTASSAP